MSIYQTLFFSPSFIRIFSTICAVFEFLSIFVSLCIGRPEVSGQVWTIDLQVIVDDSYTFLNWFSWYRLIFLARVISSSPFASLVTTVGLSLLVVFGASASSMLSTDKNNG